MSLCKYNSLSCKRFFPGQLFCPFCQCSIVDGCPESPDNTIAIGSGQVVTHDQSRTSGPSKLQTPCCTLFGLSCKLMPTPEQNSNNFYSEIKSYLLKNCSIMKKIYSVFLLGT